MIGSIIENYKVVSILGEGGMGIVYKAFDLKLERYVALKILSPQALTNPNFIARFKREAQNQAKLTHPNIVPVYGFTQDSRTFGIVMEYVDGETLEHLIKRKGRLSLQDSLIILRQILTGAGYAHSRGFVHRDIKPSNIIISNEGTAKLMDFGISKSINESKVITKTGVKIGTILYMSPEQVRAQEPTNQSDIYSIGITFYEMLSGKTPFDFGSDFEIMEAHLKRNPLKLSSQFDNIPSAADTIVGRALHKSLDRRYNDCKEFLNDVESLLNEITSPGALKKTKKKEKTHEKIIERTKFGPNSTPTVKAKIQFYAMAFLFICLFGLLFYFVYSTVSQFWKSSKNEKDLTLSMNAADITGFQWTTIASPVSNCLNAIYFVNDSIGYSCGNQGIVIKTKDGGYSWSILNDSSNIDLYDIKFITTDRGFLVGEKNTILSTLDGGNTWQKNNTDTTNSLFKIIFLKYNNTGFIVGAHGTILRTDNGGKDWYLVASPSNELLYSISFANENNGIIVGWNGVILNSSDQGKTWTEEKKISDNYLRGICFAGNEIGIIVGGGGEILRTDNNGVDWDKIKSNSISGLYAVYFSSNHLGFILGSKGEIWISKDSGKNWSPTNTGSFASFTSIAETPSGKIFITSNNGSILSK